MQVILIRHGMTQGNREKRYIGVTDEPLCSEGVRQLMQWKQAGRYPVCDRVIVSPMARCVQTAQIIYPEIEKQSELLLKECDFGKFEGKNYEELKEDKTYIHWLSSNGQAPFPEGESVTGFKKRCVEAFNAILCQNLMVCAGRTADSHQSPETVAMIVHGGTIMSIMERYELSQKAYYDYMVDNGGGYVVDFDGSMIRIVHRL